MNEKPLKPKPQVYAVIFSPMQEIAREMGYNLLMHGSFNRDFDLVAVPWSDSPEPELEFIRALHKMLTGHTWEFREQYLYSVLPGGRNSYVINLNRGEMSKYGKWDFNKDNEWYLDISITPFIKPIE